jgi:hypothetical protein
MVSSEEEVISNSGLWGFNMKICLNTDLESMMNLHVSNPYATAGWFADGCYAFACSNTGKILPSFPCEGSTVCWTAENCMLTSKGNYIQKFDDVCASAGEPKLMFSESCTYDNDYLLKCYVACVDASTEDTVIRGPTSVMVETCVPVANLSIAGAKRGAPTR